MSSLVISGDTSGAITLQAPSVAGTNTLTLPAATGTIALTSGSQTFTNLTVTNDASISGLTVGKGGGSVVNNTAVGVGVLAATATGGGNNGLGWNTLVSVTSGSANDAFGQQALNKTTTGSYNDAFGYQTLYNNTTGSSNVAFGALALNANTTASNNTAVGYQAGYSNTTGTNITLLGYQSGYYLTGSYNTGVGVYVFNGSGGTTGSYNAAFGQAAGNSLTSGSNNTFLGSGGSGVYGAGQSTTTGSNNVAVGTGALPSNTTASNNTAVGYQAGYSNTTGIQNVFIGRLTGYAGTTASYSTYVGDQAGYSITTGQYNTFVGPAGQVAYGSGGVITTGSKNSIFGAYNGNQGGLDIRTSSNYIVLSDGDGNPRGFYDGSGNFWSGTTTLSSSTQSGISLQLGTNSQLWIAHANGTGNGQYYEVFLYNGTLIGGITQNGTTGVLYNLTSDYRLKNNPTPLTGASEFIMALQPKTWDWWDGSGKGVGFIAHEFMKVAKYSGNGKKDEVDADGKPVYQSIQPSSSEVMANLVAMVQELNTLVTTQAAEIAALKAKVGA